MEMLNGAVVADVFTDNFVIIMIGIPGSGKTRMAKSLLDNHSNTVYLSSDEIRKELCGDEGDQSNNDDVFDLFYDRLNQALVAGKNAILDATNLTLKARKRIIRVVRAIQRPIKIVAFVMNVDPELCLKRNSERDRIVPEQVIERMLCTYQHPQKFEGFDEIIFANNPTKRDTGKIVDYLFQMEDFDQNNHHHAFSLGEHSLRLASAYPDNTVEYEAGIWHDIGKLFTRVNDEYGVSHFIGHANYGAWVVAANLDILNTFDKDKIQEILFYINYHMMAHCNIISEKSIKKYTELLGKERIDKLFTFALNDKIATGTWTPEKI